ncbi:MAG: response regulator, partial [Peptococcaceae bacterium]|nr:response regulator [Peptococcaceae bacterium]
LKHDEIILTTDLFDLLHRALDTMSKAIFQPPAGQEVYRQVLEQLAALASREAENKGTGTAGDCLWPPALCPGRPADPAVNSPSAREGHGGETCGPGPGSFCRGQALQDARPATGEMVRISAARLDSLLLQAEEMLSLKLAAAQRAADLREITAGLGLWEKEWAKIHPDLRAARQMIEKRAGQNGDAKFLRQFSRLLDFLEKNRDSVRRTAARLKALAGAAGQDHRQTCTMVDNLLEDLKSSLMLPLSTLLEIFPKMVRDLSRSLGKEAALTVRGGEVEIDKRVLEEIKDPLIHLIRNSVDHGIEKPEERERQNKPRCGTITIDVAQVSGGRVEITVSDDGAGIDLAKVKETAVRRGIVPEREAAGQDRQELLSLIFQPEVSTSPMITDISGRGLGLAIVREKVEKLGGKVRVETARNAGTSFRILLPVALATFRGVLVRTAGRLFVIPTAGVERVLRIRQEEITTVEGRQSFSLNGQAVALARLADVLQLPQRERKKSEEKRYIQLLILSAGGKRVAFIVDEILSEQEVLVKGLGRQLARVRNVSGAAVLGSGQVVPVLNVPDLLKSAAKAGAAGTPGDGGADRKAGEGRKSVLVVEDSITSRMLLKNIMESAGYRVETAVDGLDALTALKTANYDLVISDVEMPRVNGFELTARIRADEKLSHLPVVLVTSLESREDRERGVDAGANAYIVKSGFDHSNLLEVVRRLI